MFKYITYYLCAIFIIFHADICFAGLWDLELEWSTIDSYHRSSFNLIDIYIGFIIGVIVASTVFRNSIENSRLYKTFVKYRDKEYAEEWRKGLNIKLITEDNAEVIPWHIILKGSIALAVIGIILKLLSFF